MRLFEWVTAMCLSGAVCVTTLANERRDSSDRRAPRRSSAEPGLLDLQARAEEDQPRPVWAARTPASSRRAAPPERRRAAAPVVERTEAPEPLVERAAPPATVIERAAPAPRAAPPATVIERAAPATTARPAGETGEIAPPETRGARARRRPASQWSSDPAQTFANTYYDLPVEERGQADTPLFDASCGRIGLVTRAFHDRVCVQGSGRLASGKIVSFARRDCSCAEVCPRTGQHICFDLLDSARFPNGRGATGRPITPLSTVAVDPAVIPLGTRIYIPEFAGCLRPSGAAHDGCFVAEDRGLRIKGRRVDVFAGDESTWRAWEASVPSHRGVHVYPGDARCAVRP